jgi:hypothetical protein
MTVSVGSQTLFGASGGAASPTTTRGDLIVRGAHVDERLAVGASGRVVRSDGTDPSWSALAVADVSGAVPGTRIIGGLSLADDRSAADLRAALDAADPGIPTSGLVVDWRALALGLADGAAISSWAPSTGTGTITASGGARPTHLTTGSPAGTPAAEFDAASGHKLTLAGVAGLPTGASPGTVVAIVSRFRPVGGTGLQHLWQYGSASSASARGMAVTSADALRTHTWYPGGYVTEARSPRGQGLRVIAHEYDGVRESVIVDGVDYASAAVALTTGSANGLAVGSNLSGGELGNFRLMRLFGYSRVLTAAEWRQICDHARVAYGVR